MEMELINKVTGEVKKEDVQPVIVIPEDNGLNFRKAFTDIPSDAEVNSGEYIVDDKGYVPLATLIERCRREGRIKNESIPGDYDYDISLDKLDKLEQSGDSVSVVQSLDKSGDEVADRQESGGTSSDPDLSQENSEVITEE